MKNFSLLILLTMGWQVLFSQSAWSTLSQVTTTSSYDKDFGIEMKKVKVGPIARTLQNKEIEVDGYIIPLNGKLSQNHFMLSKYTNNMCFFCGKAGPETAMQVFLANGKKIAFTEDKIKVKGILLINENDPSGLLYTLDKATIIE